MGNSAKAKSIGRLILQLALGCMLIVGGIWALQGGGDFGALAIKSWLGKNFGVIFGVIELVAGVLLVIECFTKDIFGKFDNILGLIIMILMLEKIGLTEENFQVLCENGETITRIILPLSQKTQSEIDFISEEFVKVIEELPQFPENISAINRLLSTPDSKMSDIAMHISNDVSISAELLKMVNSAAFALASPCSSIYDAVKLVGLRGIKNLLFSIGAVQSFAKVGGNTEDLWTHAYKVAFYSYNLARNFFHGQRNVVEDAYVCGLLHDMGKIIFETSHPDFINGVRKMSVEKNISAEIFEKLLAGVNHAEIGARVAENWNFPDVIVSAIRYHHAPDCAPVEVKKLVSVVYLADLMTHYQKEDVAFYQIDVDVLKEFKLTNEGQFKKISDQLLDAFNKQDE